MEVIIHRGTIQIGGISVEVRTAKSRILIDFGLELPDVDGQICDKTFEVDGINKGNKLFEGVFFTHYHMDHIGLISEIHPDIPIYLGRDGIQIYRKFNDHIKGKDSEAIKRLRPYEMYKKTVHGDISITAFPADHSAYGSAMLLIEAEGKKILHTGDFRLHGFRAKATLNVIRELVGNVDLLITEGTNISNQYYGTRNEYELQQWIKEVVHSNKYVFVLCPSTNIDRIASFYNAAPMGRYFLCDQYQKDILSVVKESTNSKWYQFDKALTYGENLKLHDRGFVMLVRANSSFLEIASRYPEAILIYSMWKGYLDSGNPSLTEFVKPFKENGRMRILHTSGHATRGDLVAFIKRINPKQGVIPIHTDNADEFEKIDFGVNFIRLNDGEAYYLKD